MLRRTEGVVLRSFPYGEADLIVTWLTRDFGILKTFAKSPRKIKSRFGSSLEPLTHSVISFWGKEDSALPRLTQADIIHSFDSLRSGLECFVAISEMIELVLNLEPEGDRSGRAYELLVEALHSVESCSPRDILILRFKLKLLEITGFLPHMESCGRCGSEGRHFYVAHGSVLCKSCAGREKQGVSVSAGALNFYFSLLTWRMSLLPRLKPSDSLMEEIKFLINEHVRYVTEKKSRVKEFKT